MQLRTYSGLFRTLDPADKTNRAIGAIALFIAVFGTSWQLLREVAFVDSLVWGMLGALSVFLAWAISRELDPDNPISALIAAAQAVIMFLAWGPAGVLMMVWLLVTMRMVNRTSGRPPTRLDLLVVILLGCWLSYLGYWGMGVVTGLALIWENRLAPGEGRALFAAIAIMATVVVTILGGFVFPDGGPAGLLGAGAFLAAAVLGYVGRPEKQLRSVGDLSGEPLNAERVGLGRNVATTVAFAAVGWGGLNGLVDAYPLWAAFIGVALYRLSPAGRPPAAPSAARNTATKKKYVPRKKKKKR